jgi:hypothetical protein
VFSFMILLGPVVKEGLGMRKIVSTILATALLLGGLWWTWEWLTARGVEGTGPRLMKIGFWIGVFPALAGGVWLASDWFDL